MLCAGELRLQAVTRPALSSAVSIARSMHEQDHSRIERHLLFCVGVARECSIGSQKKSAPSPKLSGATLHPQAPDMLMSGCSTIF